MLSSRSDKPPLKSQSGSIFTVLLGGIVMAAALSLIVYQTLSGPLLSMVRVTKKTSSEVQARNAVNALAIDAITTSGDCDSDGAYEPKPWRVATGGAGTFPPNGGLIPNDAGLQMTDYWGTDFGYCVWDAGSKSHDASCNGDGTHNTRRLIGTTTVGVGTPGALTTIAIISAGPDRTFNTSCRNYVDTTTDVVYATVGGAAGAGGDDTVERRSYAQMLAQTSDLWMLKVSAPTTAVIDKSLEIGTLGAPQVTITPSTGLIATSGRVDATGGLRPGNAIANGACTVGTPGLLRYSTSAAYIEACDGTNFLGPSIDSLTDGKTDYAKFNVFLGKEAGNAVTTGGYNTALGYQALYSGDADADSNTAIGHQALYSNTGANNTAVGSGALLNNTSGESNVAIGMNALNSNEDGFYNTAVGTDALIYVNSSNSNTAVGYQVLQNHTSGGENTALGMGSMATSVASNSNVVVGHQADILTDGLEYSVAIGTSAGGVKVANNKTWVMGPLGTKHALYESENSSASAGYAHLDTGRVDIINDLVGSYSRIFLTVNDPDGGPVGTVYVTDIVDGGGFTILSTDASDHSWVFWELKNPNCFLEKPAPDGQCN